MHKYSKLNNAKLKILKLKEKYSKTTTLSTNGDMSLDYSGNNYIDLKVNELGNGVSPNEYNVMAHKAENLSENSNKCVDGTILGDENKSNSTSNSSIIGLKVSNKSISTLYLSENDVISDVPNQLENINFVSSSSKEYSTISQCALDNEENNSISKLIHKPNKLDVIHSEVVEKIIPVEEIGNGSDSSGKKQKSYGSLSSHDQISHTESDSSMSSIEEAMSNLINNSENIQKDVSDRSYLHQNNLVELNHRTENIDLSNISSKPKHNFVNQRINSICKEPQIKNNIKNTTIKHCDLEQSVLNNTQSDDYSQSNSDYNEAIFSITTNKSKNYKSKEKLGKKITTNKTHIPKTKKRGGYKPCIYNQLLIHHMCILKPSVKRPLLKSCKLIRYSDLNDVEFGALLNKSNYLPSTVDIEPNSLYRPPNKKACSCDGLIKQLLRNQIELTRHFIESHHQMYLNCCKAVKVINEKSTSNN